MPIPTAREHIRDIVASTADELLEALNPRTGDWGDSAPRWIFRGQMNAEWKLVPSAMRGTRDDHPFRHFGILDTPYVQWLASNIETSPNWSVRTERVKLMLSDFLDALNAQGLTIPTDSPPLDYRAVVESTGNVRRAAFPLMALAQHHGLPTLLLDWTQRAWVAAYFAALSAAAVVKRSLQGQSSHDETATHLAVWALARSNDREDLGTSIFFYDAPASANPNLRAQSGLFTWWTFDGPEDVSLDDHIAWLVAQHRGHHPELRRFILPIGEAPRLLRLLALEHIHGASMFPGVDGVVKTMKERTLWDD